MGHFLLPSHQEFILYIHTYTHTTHIHKHTHLHTHTHTHVYTNIYIHINVFIYDKDSLIDNWGLFLNYHNESVVIFVSFPFCLPWLQLIPRVLLTLKHSWTFKVTLWNGLISSIWYIPHMTNTSQCSHYPITTLYCWCMHWSHIVPHTFCSHQQERLSRSLWSWPGLWDTEDAIDGDVLLQECPYSEVWLWYGVIMAVSGPSGRPNDGRFLRALSECYLELNRVDEAKKV